MYFEIVSITTVMSTLLKSSRKPSPEFGGAVAALEVIYAELEEAEAVHRRLGCPVIDVSELSVEETAMRIIRLVEKRKQAARS